MLCSELGTLDRREVAVGTGDATDRPGATSFAAVAVDARDPRRQVWSTALAGLALFCIAVMIALLNAGCTGQVSLFPNADPALRKTPAEFAADAAKRHPFKAGAPRGGEAIGRVAVNYDADTIEVVNLSDEDWADVELWINRSYVVNIPKVERGAPQVKVLNFQMIYDSTGHTFPTNNTAANQVRQVELFRDGKMYDVRFQLAD